MFKITKLFNKYKTIKNKCSSRLFFDKCNILKNTDAALYTIKRNLLYETSLDII